MEHAETDFTKDLLLLMLREYDLFVDFFSLPAKISRTMQKMPHSPGQWGFRTVNFFRDMGDIVRLYSKNPQTAAVRLANLLSTASGEEPESV